MADFSAKPSLDHLRRQAWDLLRAQAGGTTADGRIRAVVDALTLASALGWMYAGTVAYGAYRLLGSNRPGAAARLLRRSALAASAWASGPNGSLASPRLIVLAKPRSAALLPSGVHTT